MSASRSNLATAFELCPFRTAIKTKNNASRRESYDYSRIPARVRRSPRTRPDTISGKESLKEVGWWDSMAALVFMSVADEKLGVTVSASDLGKCASIPDLLALLGDKISR